MAKDLAQANRIAYSARRCRVFTLDGELIDKSGTMSGGGSAVKKGLMSSKLVAGTTKGVGSQARGRSRRSWSRSSRSSKSTNARLSRVSATSGTRSRSWRPRCRSSISRLKAPSRHSPTPSVGSELSKEHQPSKTDDNRIVGPAEGDRQAQQRGWRSCWRDLKR